MATRWGILTRFKNPKVRFFPGQEFFQATCWATMFKRWMGGFLFGWSGRGCRYSRAATACVVAATANHMAFNRISFDQDLLVLVDLTLEECLDLSVVQLEVAHNCATESQTNFFVTIWRAIPLNALGSIGIIPPGLRTVTAKYARPVFSRLAAINLIIADEHERRRNNKSVNFHSHFNPPQPAFFPVHPFEIELANLFLPTIAAA
ncbi:MULTISPECIES: hypothetical protein [Klebsiella]|uniref:hypothetical protein n=1 Tax=Klebsiella TaxID=570 RepID=UPI000650E1BE|nr:hypothetical protein [Klebsiella quasipneumoniae]MDQ2351471.1 hypothetical protein [Klebsiella quasipneumoniae]HBW1982405.1 hypothetical protein [Klebsiella quasipneumoniae subsp. similipneumoniae]HCM6426489.1 hypothetical protein [Klebsiella quasipneumoniae]